MKTVGLIGGMSWQTTALYYKEINLHVNSELGGIHSAKLLLQSLDYAEVAKAVSTGDLGALTDLICQAGQALKAAGAQALVLCANIAHKTASALESASALPVLHIVDYTGQKIVDHGFKKVGLLATRAVMEEDFYKQRLHDHFGVEIFVPNEAFRMEADRQIFHEMSKEIIPQSVRSAWHTAYRELLRDCQVECIVLACTELRLVFEGELGLPTFETTTLHAQGIANWAIEKENPQ